jgi:D-alanyl-D-alanine carboxypeptidase (penicillin-binding protein 5/6)
MEGCHPARDPGSLPRAVTEESPVPVVSVCSPLALRRVLALLSLLVAVVVAAAGVVAAAPVPAAQVSRTLGAVVPAGALSMLPWPASATGVMIVQGVGTLGAVQADKQVPIASVAKVMTALVVLADHPLAIGEQGPSLTLTRADEVDYLARVPTGQSLLRVQAGERLSERQALEALLLPSADNIADVLARWDGGRAAFLTRMNRTARKAGALSTRYTDPSGLDPSTVSTAADQVRIAALVLALPPLMTITAERSAVLPVAGRVMNYNHLLGGPNDVFGLKTGSTSAAGGCLVFLAHLKVGSRQATVIGALLHVGQGKAPLTALADALQAASALLRASAVRALPILPPGEVIGAVSSAWGANARVLTADPPIALVLPGNTEHVTGNLRCHHPWKTRQGCGNIRVTTGDALSGTTTYTVPTMLEQSLRGPGLGWRATHAF